jgi:hypothetical protein
MKTTIDLTDTRVQYVMDLILKRADFGYPAAAKLQPAVFPVFLEPVASQTLMPLIARTDYIKALSHTAHRNRRSPPIS